MIDPEKIFHVYPVEDLQEHTLECIFPDLGEPYCECRCKPVYEYESESMLIIHNSFDGREWFEPDHHSRQN